MFIIKTKTMSEIQKKVLIIDTDQFIIRTLTTKLENSNVSVEPADQSWVAIEKLKKAKYNLIILEIIVPLFSGYEVLEHLKESTKNKTTPVIILTNLQQESDIKKTFEHNIIDYVLKYNVDLNTFTKNAKTIIENKTKSLSQEDKEMLRTKLITTSQQNSATGTPKIKILKCEKCEATLPPKTEFCPYCGTKVQTEKIIKQNY